jgi:hypothetical protein
VDRRDCFAEAKRDDGHVLAVESCRKPRKFITHLMVTDNLKKFGKGLGCVDAEYGYAWYAGI